MTMNPVSSLKTTLGLLALVGGLFATSAARADLSYLVDINTTSIINHPSGPFYLDFQAIYGSGLAQTFTVSNLTFTGGGLTGPGSATGAVSGSLGTSLTLNPSSSSFYNDFFQRFDATVSDIKFKINLSTNAAGVTPTSFSVSLLDNAVMNIPTNGVGDTLLLANINDGMSTLQTATGMGVVVSATPVPEPTTYGLAASLITLAGVVYRRRRRA